MNSIKKSGFVIGFAVALTLGALIGMNLNSPAAAQREASQSVPAVEQAKALAQVPAGASRYTVVETEGIHLIVTDNNKSIVYFYTVDQGEKPGADLHLRGTLDLNRVGDATLKPTLINPKKTTP